jgi:hypothetical protein
MLPRPTTQLRQRTSTRTPCAVPGEAAPRRMGRPLLAREALLRRRTHPERDGDAAVRSSAKIGRNADLAARAEDDASGGQQSTRNGKYFSVAVSNGRQPGGNRAAETEPVAGAAGPAK